MALLPSREICFSVLHRLYLHCDRQADLSVTFLQSAEPRDIPVEHVQAAMVWLQSERLVRLERGLGVACLTALGLATVERALASPDVSSGVFPALSGFYGISESESIGVCRTTLHVWLDQLSSCSVALELDTTAEKSLEQTLNELEERVKQANVDPQSLLLSLQELKGLL